MGAKPAGQWRPQKVLSTAEYRPAGQLMQAWPLVKKPAAQTARHEALAFTDFIPVGHTLHACEALPSSYSPATQSLHCL